MKALKRSKYLDRSRRSKAETEQKDDEHYEERRKNALIGVLGNQFQQESRDKDENSGNSSDEENSRMQLNKNPLEPIIDATIARVNKRTVELQNSINQELTNPGVKLKGSMRKNKDEIEMEDFSKKVTKVKRRQDKYKQPAELGI